MEMTELPHCIEAEATVIATLLYASSAADEIMPRLVERDFHFWKHRYTFLAVKSLWENQKEINLPAVADTLRGMGKFEVVGGAAGVTGIGDGIPICDPADGGLEPSIKLLKQKAMLRHLYYIGKRISDAVIKQDLEPEELIERIEAKIFQLAQDVTKRSFEHVLDIAARRLQQMENAPAGNLMTGVPTGFTDFDQMTAGLQKQDLILIAGETSMGKTALAMNMGTFAAKQDYTVGVFSLEMSSDQLVARLLCSEGRVDFHRFRTNYLNREEWGRLADASRRMADYRIHIDDTAGLSVSQMRPKIRRLIKKLDAEKLELDLLIIDYLQLMSGSGKQESRQQEVSQISRDLKGLAKEFDTPVIALSQLSRAPATRSDHRPQLSDLRESGSLEQDADVVAFVYREEKYFQTNENHGTAELIIAKQRNGPTGTVQLAFLKEFTRFENMWRDDMPPTNPKPRQVEPLRATYTEMREIEFPHTEDEIIN